jgi:chitin disaccharide deacetylase
MNVSNLKRLVVCADDFGLTFGASQSIVALAERGAISATSCVVDGPYAAHYAPALLASTDMCSIGLHLNLTENCHTRLNASLVTWLLRSFVLRSLDSAALESEVARQLDSFEILFGRAPAFIDGHEHVHQFPGVREALLNVVRTRYGKKVAVRMTVPAVHRGIKSAVIAALGGRLMQAQLQAEGITTNADFAGVYDLETRDAFAKNMARWLLTSADGGLIMCHPEVPASSAQAESARNAEHRFLSSPEWPLLRENFGVQLQRFDDSLGDATSVGHNTSETTSHTPSLQTSAHILAQSPAQPVAQTNYT